MNELNQNISQSSLSNRHSIDSNQIAADFEQISRIGDYYNRESQDSQADFNSRLNASQIIEQKYTKADENDKKSFWDMCRNWMSCCGENACFKNNFQKKDEKVINTIKYPRNRRTLTLFEGGKLITKDINIGNTPSGKNIR